VLGDVKIGGGWGRGKRGVERRDECGGRDDKIG
jgi:hypothetical protein